MAPHVQRSHPIHRVDLYLYSAASDRATITPRHTTKDETTMAPKTGKPESGGPPAAFWDLVDFFFVVESAVLRFEGAGAANVVEGEEPETNPIETNLKGNGEK